MNKSRPQLLVTLALLLAASGCDKSSSEASASASATSLPGKVVAAAASAQMKKQAVAAEARGAVGMIVRGVRAAAEKEQPVGDTIPLDDSEPKKTLPDSTKAVPAKAGDVAGKVYTSTAEDWASWKSLGFKLDKAQPCQLQWVRSKPTEGKAVAKCDVDGDGKLDFHVERPVTILGSEVKVGAINEVVGL